MAPKELSTENGRTELTLLVERARRGLWAIVAFTVLFAVIDLILAPALLPSVLVLKAIQLAAVAAGFSFLRRPRSRGAVLGVILAVASIVCLGVAISGVVNGDTVTTPILCATLVWVTAMLLPWGVAPQLLMALIAGLSMLLSVLLVSGDLSVAFSFPGIGFVLALMLSVLLAYELTKSRTTLWTAALERPSSPEEVKQSLEEDDQLARRWTKDLDATNRRLEEAAGARDAAGHRFKMVSELMSDYAYCFRVEADFSARVEWFTESSFRQVTGYSAPELPAPAGGLAIVHPDDFGIVLERLRSLLDGRSDVSEFRIIVKDGSIRWIREFGYPEWNDEKTRVVRVYGAAQDITASKREEERR